MSQASSPLPPSRRQFLAGSTAAVLGGTLAGCASQTPGPVAIAPQPAPVTPPTAYVSGGDVLRVGLIGCGGRGSGAAAQALSADPNVKLTAVGDAFADRLQGSLNNLKKQFADKVAVPAEHQFVGFDAYQKVIDSGVDVVLLTTPPHFRPAHLKYAIEKGKHVFCEKPVAVDAPGLRSVIETCKAAQEKKLALVSGLCWRYHPPKVETLKRVLGGAIGEIVTIQVTYNTGFLWSRPRTPQMSDMEFQMRNWLYYTWLSGDHIVEQAVHSIDKAGWVMKDQPPVRATAVGGRQVRTEPIYGQIFDHFSVVYEWANGVKCFHMSRQQDGCSSDVSDHVMGTTGTCPVFQHQINDRAGQAVWKYEGPSPDMYQVEHNELFASIRKGTPINNGGYMCNSTMMAIIGRMAAYTGKTVKWEDALNSKEDLTPAQYEWSTMPVPPVAMPGKTKFV